MRKHVQQLWWLVVVVILSVALVSCDQDESGRPTTPELTNQEISERPNPVHLANFNADQGVSDEFGAYVGHEEFVIQVPAGEYLLEYTTDLGRFHLVFRATASTLLYIGLHPGDAVQEAIIYTGTITDTSGEIQEHGNVTLFVWPGSSRTWQEVFQFSWMEE